jgi:acyl-CoA thioesterase-2
VTEVSSIAEKLLSILQLETIDVNLFRGQNEDREEGMRLFGGQVLAQALAAATLTVGKERTVHSMQGYFLRPGSSRVPVLYSVDRIRDGQSFTTRRVVGIQHGEAIFSMTASFQVAETGLTHQTTMPQVLPPEELEDDRLVIARVQHITDLAGSWATRERAFEIRSAYPADRPRPDNINNPTWIRFRHPLTGDRNLHRLLLAYASDMGFVGTSFIPHRSIANRNQLQMASLDHSIWFHRPFLLNDWLLYYRTSPTSSGARGFNQGCFYSRAGELVASTMQEGLMRIR